METMIKKPVMPLEAIVLDWAGTAVDYGCFAPVQAFAEVFRTAGLNVTMREIREPMGMLKWDHIKAVLSMPRIHAQFKNLHGRDFEDRDIDVMYAGFEEKLFSILSLFTDVKPYVLETIEALRAKHVKIGSTTGYTDAMMAIVTAGAKEKGYVPDCWFSPDSTGRMGRPYPYMVFKNMMELKISDVRRVIKVGDTISDILEGKQAGTLTAGIIEGSSEMGLSEEEFAALSPEERSKRTAEVAARYQEAGADYVFDDIRGVLELF